MKYLRLLTITCMTLAMIACSSAALPQPHTASPTSSPEAAALAPASATLRSTRTPAPPTATRTPAPPTRTATPRPPTRTATPKPPSATATPDPVREEVTAYLQAVAPIEEEVWALLPEGLGEGYDDQYASYERVKVLLDQLDALPVPDAARLAHGSLKIATLDVAAWFLYSAGYLSMGDPYYLSIASSRGNEALERYFTEYLPLKRQLARKYDLPLDTPSTDE